jgi:hypothetical protein
MDLLAECCEHRVASHARSIALRVRFIVGDREIKKNYFLPNPTPPPLVSAQCILGR